MMENFYIKVDENNVHIGHPRFESNMKQIFPDHDFTQGPPEGFMRFERVEPPVLGPYEKFDEAVGGNIAIAFSHNGLSYEIVDGVYTDVWHVLPMTAEEKLAKQNDVKTSFAQRHPTWASWSFNEELCIMQPPVPYPSDDKIYGWKESTTSWVLIPDDTKPYMWDEVKEEWVLVSPE